MKKIEYKCDHCDVELGEDSSAIEKNSLITQSKTTYKIKFLPKNTWDLCESCREKLDEWLEGKS